MTVSSYLTSIAAAAYVRDSEKQSIRNSISTLEYRLKYHFGQDLSEQFIFGSYSRETILPRSMDASSDVDYMVVFKDGSFRPQTYLDRLRRFVEEYYGRSEIEQSNPTIRLSLNHIRFELVPAVRGMIYGLNIPGKPSSYQDWIATNPKAFNAELTEKNKSHGNFIKPLARIVKYWNACNGYPFESYDLEQQIVAYNFSGVGFFSAPELRKYFYEFMGDLSLSWFAPDWKKQKVDRAKNLIKNIRGYEAIEHDMAEHELKKLIPDIKTSGLLSKGLLG